LSEGNSRAILIGDAIEISYRTAMQIVAREGAEAARPFAVELEPA